MGAKQAISVAGVGSSDGVQLLVVRDACCFLAGERLLTVGWSSWRDAPEAGGKEGQRVVKGRKMGSKNRVQLIKKKVDGFQQVLR